MLYPASLGEQPERQSRTRYRYLRARQYKCAHVPAKRLDGRQAIVEATLANDILVGRCAYVLHDRFDVEIDFPIKTMNANEREWVYKRTRDQSFSPT